MKDLTINSLFIFCLWINFNSKANADSQKPNWIERLPKEDGLYSYYIGRSSESLSETEAFTYATINAREQAIAQNFGVYTQIRSENYQSMNDIQTTQNSEAISQQVRLEEFEQVDFFKEKNEDNINVWVLFKYKKSAINMEKQRIASLKNGPEDSYRFIVSGNSEGARINGTLEVVSYPPGAPVRIDGISKVGDLELRTPLRLMGLFQAGKHTIEIDDPKFEIIQKEVVLYPGTTTKISESLKRGYGEISLITGIEGATVFLGTKAIGTTPLNKSIQIMAESTASIEIRHPEMETYRSQLEVSRGEKKAEHLRLSPRLSTISFSSDPRGADVEIDEISQNQVTPTGQIIAARGIHKIRISKSGYETHEEEIYLKGGENLVLPNVKLKYVEIHERKNTDTGPIGLKEIPVQVKKLMIPTWTIGIGYFASQSTIKESKLSFSAYGINVRIQPWDRLGFDVGGFYGEASVENKSNLASVPNLRETSIFKLGMPITLLRPSWGGGNGSISLIPEYLTVSNEYVNDKNSNSSTGTKTKFPELTIKQKAVGGSLEYKILRAPQETSRSVMGISITTGFHKYNSIGKQTGAETFSTGLSLIVGF